MASDPTHRAPAVEPFATWRALVFTTPKVEIIRTPIYLRVHLTKTVLSTGPKCSQIAYGKSVANLCEHDREMKIF
jgi:hypothetical protein